MSRVTSASLPALPISRRNVLGLMAGALVVAPFAGLRAQSLLERVASGGVNDNRSLRFVHTHTGEKLSVNYWCDGALQTQCLAPLNHFLRDFRTGDVANMDVGLLDTLYELQVLADRDATFEIISAYRSPATNAALSAKSSGVAKHSLHMEGRAVDIRITGFSTKTLQQLALSRQRGGVGYYAKSDFVHVDTGPVRRWVG
jgi:uncharacterized protein YcbK (DUF882 family)